MKTTNSGFCPLYFNGCMERTIKASLCVARVVLHFILTCFAKSHADFDGNATACISKNPVQDKGEIYVQQAVKSLYLLCGSNFSHSQYVE